MTILNIWFGSLTLIFTLWARCEACGISTHTEIAHRALEFFSEHEGGINYKKLIQKHQDAYQAGVLYSDSFYPDLCKNGVFHDVSEDSHWTPFLKAMINYIRDNYPKPWDETTEKLVVFMFGIASHMVSDVTWHSLGIDQGFLSAMGGVDFHGSFSQAHSVGDFGGDVIGQFELNFDYVQKEWYVPVKDLVKIYEEFYGRQVIDEPTVTECSSFQYLALLAELAMINKLFPVYAKKSLFLVERFYEYFLGGVDDMAFWTTKVFKQTVQMLENGTGKCFLPENPIFIDCDGKKGYSYIVKRPQISYYTHMNSSLLDPLKPVMKVISAERGVFFQLQSWAQGYLQFTENSNTMKAANYMPNLWSGPSKNIDRPTASYYVTTPYARLGWVMTTADLNQDGYEDLVIGAPGYSRSGHVHIGRIYVVYNTGDGLPSDTMDLDIKANLMLEGTESSGRFGSSVAVLDFNRDGIMDLAVGAPSVGAPDRSYTGRVYVYFGSKTEGLLSKPSVTINCSRTYCNLGWKLLAADMDGDGADDLVTGSPYAPGGGKQRGLVAAFYSKTNISGHLTIQDADWLVTGEHDYSWFGYSLHTDRLENKTLLVTGSPTWRICKNQDCSYSSADTQNVGKVYGYFPPSTQYEFAVSGDKEGAKLGSSFASGQVSVDGVLRRVLLVGASTYDVSAQLLFISTTFLQAGQALLYELAADKEPSLLSTFSGDRQLARFGEVVHLNDLDSDGLDDVIITSPLRTGDVTGLLGEQEGRVYIFNGKELTSDPKKIRCKSWISPCPQSLAQIVLNSPEAKSRFGSAVVTIKSKAKNEVLVAAERSSMMGRLAGAVHLYSL